MTEPFIMRKKALGRFWRLVSAFGLTMLWGAVLLDLGQWFFRLNESYSPLANLLSHFWPYLSLGGALAGLLARGAPNVLRSFPTVWLLVSLAILYGGQVMPRSDLSPPIGTTLRLLTLNLGQRNSTRPETIAFLRKRHKIDIVFLQEVEGDPGEGDRPIFEAALKGQFPHSAWHSVPGRRWRKYGLGILSRYPLNRTQVVPFPENEATPAHCRNRSVLATEIQIHGRPVSLATVHLCRFAIPWRRRGGGVRMSYRTVSDWLRNSLPSENTRRLQIELLQKMAMEGGPFVLGGDFNTTSHSLDLIPLSRVLTNAFEERGRGFGHTFFLRYLGLGERIDHIFHSRGNRTREAFVHDVNVSDHRPLEAVLEFLPEKMFVNKDLE
jgi:endonuclease/exonuclease/phosphatase family metal-dependent hydrolase